MKKANAWALLPIGIFVVLYLGLGIVFEYILKISMGFYSIPIVVIFLVALFNGSIFNKNTTTVKVPDLEGENYEKLRDYEGLSIEVLEYRYDDEVPNGVIISQTPEADEMVVEGSVIKIIVSMGVEPEVKLMEDLVGEDYK